MKIKIEDGKTYKDLPNGTILKVIPLGKEWDDDIGETFDVVKIDNRLFETNKHFFDFNEKDDNGYEFIVTFEKKEYI